MTVLAVDRRVLTFEHALTGVIITNSPVMLWDPRIARSAS